MHTVMSHISLTKVGQPVAVTFLICSICTAFPQNEHKEVKVDEILGREKAEEAIKDAMVRCSHLYKGVKQRAGSTLRLHLAQTYTEGGQPLSGQLPFTRGYWIVCTILTGQTDSHP